MLKKIVEFENHISLKNDPELLKFVCKMVENTVKKDIDKKELVLEIYHKVFSLNDTEKKYIGEQIDFLCNNDLISKVHGIKKNSKIFVNYIKSKLWKSITNKTNIISQFLQIFYSKKISTFLITKVGLSKLVVTTILLIL